MPRLARRAFFVSREWHSRRDLQLFVASKFPIRSAEDLGLEQIAGGYDQYQERGGAAGCYELELPGGSIRIVNLHLISPHHPMDMLREDPAEAGLALQAGSDRRASESSLIRSRTERLTGPVIFAGDFNMPTDSPLWRRDWSKYRDAFEASGFGYGYGYRIRRTVLRIDHILGTTGIVMERCRLGPDVGSPHRPLIADLVISSAGSNGPLP